MLSRRDFLSLAAGAGAGTLLASCGSKPAARVESPRARYWVQMLLSGGHDALYTTDPKRAEEVDDLVTLPTDNQITAAGELRFGPHFAPLARWSSQLTVLNGVQVRTVNHETGQRQFLRLKTNIVDAMPGVLDIIASQRAGQPLGVAYLNVSSRLLHTPGYFGTADKFYFGKGDVFEIVAETPPDELAALAKVMRDQASAIAQQGGGREAAQTALYLSEVASFFDRVVTVPPLAFEERSTDYVTQSMAESLERALWLLEHDLCCGVVLDLGLLGWDSHVRNETKQAEMNGSFVTFFDDYLAGLHTRTNRHGKLADQTVTVVGSELGRFPHQNEMLGKDHLPQTSFVFAGPGIRPGRSFGRTGRRMEGLPIAYQDGHDAAAGRVPLLDDVGATLLRLAALDPEHYGHSGRVCDFLLDRGS